MGLRADDLRWLLEADPFVPFEVHIGSRHSMRIEDPADVSWRGDVPVIRDGRGFTLVNLSHVVFIYVEGAAPNPPRG